MMSAMALTPESSLLGTVLIISLLYSINAMDIPKDYNLEGLIYPPVILNETSQKYVVYPYEDITLTCEAKKLSSVSYRWEKDGMPFDTDGDSKIVRKPNSGTLTILNSNGNMMDYKGKYRCFVRNSLGIAITHEINVIMEETPKWQKEIIKPIKVEEGESIVLPCNPPQSAVPPRVIWMNSTLLHITQDDRVSMGSNGNLYFSNVKIQDERPDYICYAQFVGARTIVAKEPIVLKVTRTNLLKSNKPEMMMPTGSSSNYLALRGNQLQLECIAKGLPTPKVEWTSLTGSMNEGRFHFDEFKKTLLIDNVQYEDDGQYQCTAQNSEGKVQHTYTVTVESAPYWIKKPESGVYGPGENAVLTCDVDGKPKPVVTWMINGEPLKDSDLNDNLELKDGTLILRDLQMTNTSVVQCEARNLHGYILTNAYVYVIELPPKMLTLDEVVYSVVENADVWMDCRVFGAPVPAISWQDEMKTNVLIDQRFALETNGTLTISEVQKDDMGLYTCFATNIKGSANISAILNVKNATQIITPPNDQRVRKGWKAIFECKALFDSTLDNTRVEWKKDETEINDPDDSDKYFIDVNYTLSITNVQEDDHGTYKCVARTDLDSVEKTAELVVMDLPDPPYDLELSDEDDMSVTLSWTPADENNSPIEEFIIEFEEDRYGPGVWHELTRVNGDQISANLDLSPYVNYQFRVRAVNEVGPSNGSKPSDRFQTEPAAPTKNPREVKGEGTEPNNMYISWKPLKGIDWNGEGFGYLVRWRRQGLDETWQEEKTQSPPILVQYTNTYVPYEIKVQSFNNHGTAPEPKTVIGYSGEDFPDTVPENVGLESISESTIKVAWLPVQKEGLNGHLRGFKVQCIGHGGRPHPEVMVHGNTTHALVTGLQPFSNYTVKVRVFNGKGNGRYSESASIRTNEGVPSKPSFLKLDRLSDSSLTLTWGPPDSANGILTGYEIYYEIVNSTNIGEKSFSQTINDPLQQNWTVTNISSNYTYRFYLYATTSAGQSDPVVREGGTMQEIEFPPNMNVSMKAEERRIMITLDARKNVELKVQIKSKSNDLWQTHGKVNTSQSFYELDELMPGTTYDIRLMATNRTMDVNIWNSSIITSGVDIIPEHGRFATEGWFIGLISAIVLLLLILIILCFIKRSKGGKYSVKDKEDTQVDSEARPMKDETFGEYSDNDEKPFTSSQPSLNGDIKPLGSDDSLADYGGSVDVQFNEDGSFIGQYSGKKEKEAAGGNESSGATSPVIPNIPIE
ncbi:neural cell adhesion molecule L1 isoform X1 [Pelobates cultripes]|uniref:Neural cell adhesion molecule L1 n=1 Tax=Pelobates cultripes TaxID=61616 RepID=A0AAD1T412_PELCU|nr:neural cell adhesion molecule L1 isoform X1 [Pelobates cultripes]